jgi:olfactory receptor
MTFDHYIAICNPLHYFSILTNDNIMKIGVTILCRSSLLIPPVIIRLKFLDYCCPHFLSHSFWLHQDLIQMACSDVCFNRIVVTLALYKNSIHRDRRTSFYYF